MATAYPNQPIVIVHKEISDKEHPYSIINGEASDIALGLSNNEFKLWFYLARNQNDFKFNLSKADFCKLTKCSKNTYYNSIDGLIEKGYLVQKENSNTYYFYEGGYPTPSKTTIEIPPQKKETILNFVF